MIAKVLKTGAKINADKVESKLIVVFNLVNGDKRLLF